MGLVVALFYWKPSPLSLEMVVGAPWLGVSQRNVFIAGRSVHLLWATHASSGFSPGLKGLGEAKF